MRYPTHPKDLEVGQAKFITGDYNEIVRKVYNHERLTGKLILVVKRGKRTLIHRIK